MPSLLNIAKTLVNAKPPEYFQDFDQCQAFWILPRLWSMPSLLNIAKTLVNAKPPENCQDFGQCQAYWMLPRLWSMPSLLNIAKTLINAKLSDYCQAFPTFPKWFPIACQVSWSLANSWTVFSLLNTEKFLEPRLVSWTVPSLVDGVNPRTDSVKEAQVNLTTTCLPKPWQAPWKAPSFLAIERSPLSLVLCSAMWTKLRHSINVWPFKKKFFSLFYSSTVYARIRLQAALRDVLEY